MTLFLAIFVVLVVLVAVCIGVGYLLGRTVRHTDEEWRQIMSYEHLQAGEDPRQ